MCNPLSRQLSCSIIFHHNHNSKHFVSNYSIVSFLTWLFLVSKTDFQLINYFTTKKITIALPLINPLVPTCFTPPLFFTSPRKLFYRMNCTIYLKLAFSSHNHVVGEGGGKTQWRPRQPSGSATLLPQCPHQSRRTRGPTSSCRSLPRCPFM